MKTIVYLFLMISAVILNACSGCENRGKKSNNLDKVTYKSIENSTYKFRFKIPENWAVVDSSDNGDGYFIKTDNADTDIRIYAQRKILDSPKEDCQSTKEFVFNDGYIGATCTLDEGKEFFIYRSDSALRVIMYVMASKKWVDEHKSAINAVAGSMSIVN